MEIIQKRESEIESEARKLRSERIVTYNGQKYNVEAIVQASIAEAKRIVQARRNGKRDAKKDNVRAKVKEFISDTEEMMKGYDKTEGLTK